MTREERKRFIAHANREMASLASNPGKKHVGSFPLATGDRVVGTVLVRPTARKPLKASVHFELDHTTSALIDSLLAGNPARFLSGGSEENPSIVVDWQLESLGECAA